MIQKKLLAVATLGLFAAGCAVSGAGDEAPVAKKQAAWTPQPFSNIGMEVLGALQNHGAGQGSSWNFSRDNALDSGFLIQSPEAAHWGQAAADVALATTCEANSPGCNNDFLLRTCQSDNDCEGTARCEPLAATVKASGQSAQKLCIGNSDHLLDDIYTTLVQTKNFADVTSLTPADGRFEAAFRNALTYLANDGSHATVRFMFGNYPGAQVSADDTLAGLVRDLPQGSSLKVSVGAYRYNLDSWNHSKIIAVDGKVAITGGHNLWTQHYLAHNPVHDLSMRLSGTAAQDAHLFANEMWDHTCYSWSWGGSTDIASYPSMGWKCPAFFQEFSPQSHAGNKPVISVGRYGRVGDNAADKAQLAMIGAAQSSVYLSLQDLGPVKRGPFSFGPWPTALFRTLAGVIAGGADVYVVLSNPGSVAGGVYGSGSYSNGWSLDETAERMAEAIKDEAHLFAPDTDLDALLCSKLHVAGLRFSSDSKWADGDTIANHSKMFIVDQKAYYIGSQNLYSANLAEHGYIVDDPASTQSVIANYWQPMWQYSQAGAISGSNASSCFLQ